MKRPMSLLICTVALVVSGFASSALGELTITLGTQHLLPNTPNQVVEIFVTGGDEVQALDLALMTANGGPELEALNEIQPGTGVRGPLITQLDILTDTIFAANHLDPQLTVGESGVYQVAFGSVITVSGSVRAEGLLARVTLDTTGLFQGTYAFSLTAMGVATDFAGVPVSLTDGLLVVGTEVMPWAEAGPDQTVVAGTPVRLTGSGSGLGGAAVTYLWHQIDGPAVVLSDPHSASMTFTAPAGLNNTRLAFELTVSDGTNVRTDSVAVLVSPDEALFSVNAGSDQLVDPATFVPLHATVLNAGTRIVTVEWTQVGGPTVALTGANSINPSFLAPGGITNTPLVFQARAFDATYETVDTVTVTVGANQATVAADAGYDQEVAAAATVQLAGTASDPTGMGVSYYWLQIDGPQVRLSGQNVANPTFTAPSLTTASQLEFELRVFSSGAIVSIDTVIIHVAAGAANTSTQTPTTEQEQNPTEQANYPTPVQTQQPLFSALDWPTSTSIAVGAGLLILAFLLLWILWL